MTGDLDPRIRVCAVCARVLEYVEGQGYCHGVVLFDNDEHVAVPVLPDQVKTDWRCDFCFAPAPQWELPARDFDIPGSDNGSLGNWSVCTDCSRFIRLSDWSGLTQRITVSWESRHGEPLSAEAKAYLGVTFFHLRKAITGPLRPFDPTSG